MNSPGLLAGTAPRRRLKTGAFDLNDRDAIAVAEMLDGTAQIDGREIMDRKDGNAWELGGERL